MTRERFIKVYALNHKVSIEEATRVADFLDSQEKGPITTAAGKIGNAMGMAILIPMYILGAIVAIRIVLAILGII